MSSDEGHSAAVDQVVKRVHRLLEELYGADGFHTWSDSAFIRVVEQQVVFLVLTAFHQDDVVLNVRCYVVRDVLEPNEALGYYLACINSEQLFGGFSLDDDGDVCFDYSLIGSSVTKESLSLAIEIVANAASRNASEIISRWGGVSSLEKLRLQMESLEHGEESTEVEDDDGPAN